MTLPTPKQTQQRLGAEREALSDAELMILFCQTLDKIEANSGFNAPNALLRDFVRELLKMRLLARVRFVRLGESSRPK